MVVLATAPLLLGVKVKLLAKPEAPPEVEEISNPEGGVITRLFTRLLAEILNEELEDAVPENVLKALTEPVTVIDEQEFNGASVDEIANAVVPEVALTVLILPVAQTPFDEIAQPTTLPEATSSCSILLTPVDKLLGIIAFQAPALVEYPVIAEPIAALIFSTQVTATGRPVPVVFSYNATKFFAVALLPVLCINEQAVEAVPNA